VAELNLAEHLADGGLSAAEVAEREGSAQDSTFRLLRAAAAHGLVTRDGDHRFHSTPLLATLRRDGPRSLRGLALGRTVPGLWLTWNHFPAAVRTGGPQVESALGSGLFEHFEAHPDEGAMFSEAMTSATAAWAPSVAARIDLTGVTRIADIGGSNGSLAQLLLQADPTLHGVILDRPEVISRSAREIARNALDGRLVALAGDFFEEVPEADLYLLKFILHDWDDESCVTILRNCRSAMRPGGRVAIVEMVIDAAGEAGLVELQDLNMLVATSGRERSLDEYDALLTAAGLHRRGLIATDSPLSVIEAVVT
jgi:hypothetical protein